MPGRAADAGSGDGIVTFGNLHVYCHCVSTVRFLSFTRKKRTLSGG